MRQRASLTGLIALVPFALVGCFWTTTFDGVPTMTLNGLVYTRALAQTAQVTPEDLRPLGEPESLDDATAVVGRTVFSLEGVPPDRLVVMRSSNPENGDYLFYWRPEPGTEPSARVSDESGLVEFVNSIPGLCAYFEEAPCPSGSHRPRRAA